MEAPYAEGKATTSPRRQTVTVTAVQYYLPSKNKVRWCFIFVLLCSSLLQWPIRVDREDLRALIPHWGLYVGRGAGLRKRRPSEGLTYADVISKNNLIFTQNSYLLYLNRQTVTVAAVQYHLPSKNKVRWCFIFVLLCSSLLQWPIRVDREDLRALIPHWGLYVGRGAGLRKRRPSEGLTYADVISKNNLIFTQNSYLLYLNINGNKTALRGTFHNAISSWPLKVTLL